MSHKVYMKIIDAINSGKLIEPFSNQDFREACPGLGDGTYNAFLYKHKLGNKKNNSELVEQIGVNKFRLIRPFRYGVK